MKLRAAAIVSVVMAVIFSSHAMRADDLATLRVELREAEVQLAMLARTLPVANADDERQFVETLLRKAELDAKAAAVNERVRLSLRDGSPAPIEVALVDMTGRDQFADVARFLWMLDLAPRAATVDSMRASAAGGDTVEFALRVGLATYAPVEPDPATSRDPIALLRARLEADRSLIALLEETIARRNATALHDALAGFTNALDNSAISIRNVQFDGELAIEGLAVGGAARAALKDALTKAPFTLVRIDMPAEGACREFAVEARLKKEERELDAVVIGNGVFDPMTASACNPQAGSSPATLTARGSDPGGVRLKLRNVDVSDFLLALHDATGEDFVVDSSVDVRVNADIADATLAEALSAVRPAGLSIGEGPLRRVSAAARPRPLKDDKFTGDAVSFALRHADVRDVLCLFARISGLEIDAPADLDRRVTIFAKDVAWDRALSGVIDAAGLQYKIAGTRVLVAPEGNEVQDGGLVDACTTFAIPHSDRMGGLRLEQLGAADLRLAGTARVHDGWQAYVAVPGGRVLPLGAGQQLFDARVEAVDQSGVVLRTGDAREVRVRIED